MTLIGSPWSVSVGPSTKNNLCLSMMTKHFVSVLLCCGWAVHVWAAQTAWNFEDPADWFRPSGGPGSITYFDPDGTGWGPRLTRFGKASQFGLPAMAGGDPDVMGFPACTARQGYLLTHGGAPNGPYGETDALVSNYTLLMDVLFPSASDGRWRALWQTGLTNTSDADFFVQNAASGGVGINGNYRGQIVPNRWYRLALVMRAAPGEGQCLRYLDGQFIGAIGTTGSGLEIRFALGAQALLFTDDNGETAEGFVASIGFVDRAMRPDEIQALGGCHAGGVLVPGDPAPPYAQKMVRRVGAIGHRGGSFGRAPDNTLAAVRAAIEDGAVGIEVDTRLTADGVCVCFHDSTVDRTTDGTGPVAAKTLAELKALDAGSWFDPAFAGERVPTLAEVLAEAKGKVFVYLDLKVKGQAPAIRAAIQETGFPVDQLWFWTPGDAAEAQAIRSVIPDALIFWGAPASSWSTDPTYFSQLRALGVVGFSFSAGTGNPDPAFVARAKQEGFIVEIYTILDPDSMLRAAAAGVDYVETDFPATMNALQPTQLAKASQPFPPDQATNVPTDLILYWVVGQGATTRRVFFGTAPPGQDLGVQTSDLLVRSDLAYGTTYYWRVDEMSAGSTVPGDVWSFTTRPAPASANLVGLWLFDRPTDLGHATIGRDLEVVGVTPAWSRQLADDHGNTMLGAITTVGGPANYLRCIHGIRPNGGGAYVNRYSIVMDIFSPPGSRSAWRAIFQTSENNANDADYFIRNTDDRLGVAALGYAPAINETLWTRLVVTVALEATASSSVIRTYLNGNLHYTHTGQALDGRFSLGPTVLFFADDNNENAPLHVAALAIYDGPLSAADVAALGVPRPAGLFAPPILAPPTVGQQVILTWRATPGYWLQRSTNLTDWESLEATFGLGSHAEPVRDRAFFRVVPR